MIYTDFMSMSSKPNTEHIQNVLTAMPFENIKLLSCERFDVHSSIWNFERHSHDFYEFLYFIDGKARIEAGKDMDINMFNLVIYPPGVYHEEKLDTNVYQEVYCFWIAADKIEKFDQGILVKDTEGEFRSVIEKIYKEFKSDKVFRDEMLRLYIKILYTLLNRYFSQPPIEKDALSDRCKLWIQEHYLENFDICSLAQAVFVSESYLFRYFKHKTGMTPMQYRNYLRIEKAKYLLCASNFTLDCIAEELGFSDARHFSHLFKKIEGISPGAFRQKRKS